MPIQSPDSAAKPQGTAFDSLLVQCRDLVSERVSQALARMLDNANEALSALINESRDAAAKKLYTQVREKTRMQREAIEKQFRVRYLREFQERSNRVRKIGDSFAEMDLSSLELELVGEEDLDETLRFNAMAAKLRQYCDEELIALDQRVGVLLGDASLQAEDNPFTPQAICDAYKATCRQFDPSVEVRMVLLKLFDDHVIDEMRAVYKSVNALLVQNSILPKIRISTRAESAKPQARPEPSKPATATDEKTPDGGPDLFTVLKNLRNANVAGVPQAGPGGGGAAPAVPIQGADLLGLLTRIQLGDVTGVTGNVASIAGGAGGPGTSNVLRELKSTSVGTGMNQLDTMTLDIMSLVFDQLFDDPKIPVGVKGLIGRLQIPMLKVAIADKTFFSRRSHPARHLLDTLGEIALRLPAQFNASSPLFGRMEVIVQKLIDSFENSMEVFDVARVNLEELIAEEDARIGQDTASAAHRSEQTEKLALAKTIAQAEIKARLRISNIPGQVIEFLIQQWVQVLLVVHVVDGEDSAAWKTALETMDLLIWSVEPKHTNDERQELAVIVPEVLQRIAAGLRKVEIEDAVRADFFAELRELHSGIINKADAEDAAPAQQTPNDTAGAARADADSTAQIEALPVTNPGPDAVPAMQTASISVAQAPPVADNHAQPVPVAHILPEPVMPITVAEIALSPAPESTPVPNLPAPVAGAKTEPVSPESMAAPLAEAAALPTLELAPSVPALQPVAPITSAPEADALPAPIAEPVLAAAAAANIEPLVQSPPALAAAPALAPHNTVDQPPSTPIEFVPVLELPLEIAHSVPIPERESVSMPVAQVSPKPADQSAPAADLAFLPDLKSNSEDARASDKVPEPVLPTPAPVVPASELGQKSSASPPSTSTSLPDLDFQSVPSASATPTGSPVAPVHVPAAKPGVTAAGNAKPAVASPPAAPPGVGKPTIAHPAPVLTSRGTSVSGIGEPGSAAVATASSHATPPDAQRAASSAPPVQAAQRAPMNTGARTGNVPNAASTVRPPAAVPSGTSPPSRPASAPTAKPGSPPPRAAAPAAKPASAPVRSDPKAALDFTAPVTVQNPFGGGKVEVQDLDFTTKTAASPAAAKRDATPAELPRNLAVGTWVGIRGTSENEARKSAKLSYISPLKTRYLFVDRQGKNVLDCTRADLARRFQLGEVIIMDEVPELPLFERITQGLVGKLGANKQPVRPNK